jgi:hypothetical protein
MLGADLAHVQSAPFHPPKTVIHQDYFSGFSWLKYFYSKLIKH